jgi:hypothetical protein
MADQVNADVERLLRVQGRVRELTRTVAWLPAAIRRSMRDFRALSDRHTAEKDAVLAHHREKARAVLGSGKLRDPAIGEGTRLHVEDVEGLCPAMLAAELGVHPSDSLPPEIEARSAEAALAALERDTEWRRRDLAEERRLSMAAEYRRLKGTGEFVEYSWRVYVVREERPHRQPNPGTKKPGKLARFSPAEYRTIMLYRLGGLADAGSPRPVVARPGKTGERVADMAAYLLWRFRHPSSWDNETDFPTGELDPTALPAAVAEQFLADLEQLIAALPAVPRGLWDYRQPKTPTDEDQAIRDMRGAAAQLITGYGDWFQEQAEFWAAERRKFLEAHQDWCRIRDERNAYCRAKWDSGHAGAIPELQPLPPEPFNYTACEHTNVAWSTLATDSQLAIGATRLLGLHAANGHPQVTDFLFKVDALCLMTLHGSMDSAEAAVYLRLVLMALSGQRADLDQSRFRQDRQPVLGGPSEEPQAEPRGESVPNPTAPKPLVQKPASFAAADDFTWVVFADEKYDFTKGNQSECMRALWESWEKGGRRDGCGLSEKTLGEKCGSSASDFRLALVFRGHKALGRIIRPTVKGAFGLFLPESPFLHTS